MVKHVVTLLLFMPVLTSTSFAGKKSEVTALEAAVLRLDKALMAKNMAELHLLLNDNLQYVHSNGWMETAADVQADLLNGKLSYNSITQNTNPTITVVHKTGLVRE